jgi:hypothetical protein
MIRMIMVRMMTHRRFQNRFGKDTAFGPADSPTENAGF